MNKMTLGATAQPRYLEYRLDMLGEKEGLFKAKSRRGGQMFVYFSTLYYRPLGRGHTDKTTL